MKIKESEKRDKYLCGSTPAFPKYWDDSAFNLLTVPFGWLSYRMALSIRLSTHVFFLSWQQIDP